MRKLGTFARYGARIDKDIGRALQALRVLRNRPDAWIDELQNGTSEPGEAEPQQESWTTETPPRTPEPNARELGKEECTPEPERRLNRHQRRALAALTRKRAA